MLSSVISEYKRAAKQLTMAEIDPIKILDLISELSKIGNKSDKLQRVVNEFVSGLCQFDLVP